MDITIRDGQCPRCESTVIKTERASMPKSSDMSLKAHLFDIYICKKCGYTEFYYDREAINW